MKRRAFCALIFMADGASASRQLSVPLRELYSMADYVGVIEITGSRAVSSSGETCGARYVGRVIDEIKGIKTGQLIEFGFVPSLKVGFKYLVLLGENIGEWMEVLPDFYPRCKNALPRKALVGLWRGAMEVQGSTDNASQRESWTVVPVSHVDYPVGTRSRVVAGNKQLVFTDLVARMKDER